MSTVVAFTHVTLASGQKFVLDDGQSVASVTLAEDGGFNVIIQSDTTKNERFIREDDGSLVVVFPAQLATEAEPSAAVPTAAPVNPPPKPKAK